MTFDKLPTAGPLKGVRVLDLTQVLAGPYCSLLLADMGADVVKIERPPDGDPVRKLPPLVNGESTYFLTVNRNKRSMMLDLSHPDGVQVFYDLTRGADVVLDNFRPGVMERLSIDYPQLQKINPSIIICSISAFGSDGPYHKLPAYDLIIQAMSGAMSVTGEAGRPPVRMGLPMGDLGGGLFGALGVMATLFERERSGRGQQVDVSLLDGLVGMLTYLASSFFATGQQPEPVGSAHPSIVPYQAFETSDGYLVVAVLSEAFWINLCKAMQLERLTADSRFISNALRIQNRQDLIPVLEDAFRQRSRAEWLEILAGAGVPAGPVNSLGEALLDPQVTHRKMITSVNHPVAGEVGMSVTPLKGMGAGGKSRPAPLLGQHTREVLGELSDYSTEAVEKLLSQGVIFDGESNG